MEKILKLVIGVVIVMMVAVLTNWTSLKTFVVNSEGSVFFVNRTDTATEIANNVSSITCPAWLNVDNMVKVADGNRGLITKHTYTKYKQSEKLYVYVNGETVTFDIPEQCAVIYTSGN